MYRLDSSVALGVGFSLIVIAPITAQIVPDNSLGTQTVVRDNLTQITDGTRAGNNLFHSFTEFNVGAGQQAEFLAPGAIQNILGRVTGNNISDIAGELISPANLFLINPNGFIFHESVTLGVNGDFTATTGGIQFPDDKSFDVSSDTASLSIEVPKGVQVNGTEGIITVLGSGNQLFSDPEFFDTATIDRPQGLAVNLEQNLTLAAPTIHLDGGNITAPDGIITLVTEGNYAFGTELDLATRPSNGAITLENAASASARGFNGGGVNLKAGDITIADGSAILGDTEGDGMGKDVNVSADSLTVIGHSETLSSTIANDVTAFAAGTGGDLNIDANRVDITSGGFISNVSYDVGENGDINLAAKSLTIDGEGLFPSTISNQSGYFGNSGDINIDAETVNISNYAEISTIAFSEGVTGDINLDAQELNIDTGARVFVASVGNSTGNANINAKTINFTNGGRIEGLNLGFGDLGAINIDAETITGNGDDGFSLSGIGATNEGEGTGGTVNITVESLTLENGASIEGSTFGFGRATDINITAKNLSFSGTTVVEGEPIGSGIRSGSDTFAEGTGGDVEITTETLTLEDGAQISNNTDSNFDAGNITIEAETITVTGEVADGSSGIITSATTNTGNGGVIEITTDELNISNGGTITASNFVTRRSDVEPGSGNPGSILIETRDLNLSGNRSAITTNTVSGNDGNIIITANSLTLDRGEISSETIGDGNGGTIEIETVSLDSDRGKITTSATREGSAGNINLSVAETLTGKNLALVAESIQSGGGDINLNTGAIRLQNNSLISTSVRDSNGGGGDITIDNDRSILLRSNSDIRANAFAGPGGNITIDTETLLQSPSSDIDASSRFGLDGEVEIQTVEDRLNTVEETAEIADPQNLLTSFCPVAEPNSFAILGKGAIPYQNDNLLAPVGVEELLSRDNSSASISFNLAPQQKLTVASNWYESCST